MPSFDILRSIKENANSYTHPSLIYTWDTSNNLYTDTTTSSSSTYWTNTSAHKSTLHGYNEAISGLYRGYRTSVYQTSGIYEEWREPPVYKTKGIYEEWSGTGIDSSNYESYTNSLKDIRRTLLRTELRNKLYIDIRVRNGSIKHTDGPESVALETLRQDISEREYRKYIKYGFLLVKGKSGAIYQIFQNRAHTKVWKDGRLIEEVCVRIKDKSIPATDNVIAFKNIIECDEESFKKLGNVYNMRKAA